MNDLSGLSWDSSPSTSQTNRPVNGSNYAALRPTPPNVSRQATPLSANNSGRNTPPPSSNGSATKSAGQDSFSSLLPTKKTAQLSLQERQKQLIEERARQQAEQQKRHNEQFTFDDANFWEGLGTGNASGRSTPATNGKSGTTPQLNTSAEAEDDDILAAFNASAPVDSSSHFPPPQNQLDPLPSNESRESSLPNRKSNVSTPAQVDLTTSDPSLGVADDDDDPFGLGQISAPSQASKTTAPTPMSAPAEDDDDVLGILGKPVAEVSRPPPQPQALVDNAGTGKTGSEPRDQAIAELVEMGFSVDRSREALDNTDTGVDVQAAVGWLLNQAHEKSKSKSRTGNREEQPAASRQPRRSEISVAEPDALSEDRNAWLAQRSRSSRTDSRSPGIVDKDVAQRASDLGSTLFKSANSLWRTGQKRVQKAMAEFQQEGDSSQPRWLREHQAHEDEPQSRSTASEQPRVIHQSLVTDEAMMLDADRAPARSNRPRPSTDAHSAKARVAPAQPRGMSAAADPSLDLPPRPMSRPTERLSKQAVEEQSAQAYVSPARRKKPQPRAPPPPPAEAPEPDLDIFLSSPQGPPQQPSQSTSKTSSVASRGPPMPLPSRPRAPPRHLPSILPSSLSQSTRHRMEGTAAFKRGDYATAHSSYTSALTPLPPQHPIAIILYSNRALTSLKTGEPKAAVADADAALEIIGPSRGEGEVIVLDQGESEKPMKEFYGKALMRKAEALEHLEKWADAAQVWRDAIAVGVGGGQSIQGRNRCERAAGIAPVSAAAPTPRAASTTTKKTAPAKPRLRSAADDLAGPGAKESEAVTRLRAANAAATAASDEAFALNDTVEARLNAWKNGKEGNLRALLASLDTVLWEDAGWNKVGMGDLVLPNRCKVVYMKAIAKCHPDKIPPNASTEQRMISGSVFATLNEAWDRFKRDNGL